MASELIMLSCFCSRDRNAPKSWLSTLLISFLWNRDFSWFSRDRVNNKSIHSSNRSNSKDINNNSSNNNKAAETATRAATTTTRVATTTTRTAARTQQQRRKLQINRKFESARRFAVLSKCKVRFHSAVRIRARVIDERMICSDLFRQWSLSERPGWQLSRKFPEKGWRQINTLDLQCWVEI